MKTNLHAALNLIPILVISLLAQGCVGFGVLGAKSKTYEPPSITEKKIEPQFEPVRAGFSTPGALNRVTNPTASWLRDHWGAPTSIRHISAPNQLDIWTYKFGPAWYGVVPCIVVPLPLAVPAKREKVVFYLREDRVVRAEVINGAIAWSGATLFSPEGPFVGSWGWENFAGH